MIPLIFWDLQKFNAKLKEMNDWLNTVRNIVEIKEWWKVLAAKIRGYYEYYVSLGIMQVFYRISRVISTPHT